MKPRKQLNRVTRALLSVGFLGGLHLMLSQAGVPAGGGIPGAPITPVPGAAGGAAPIPGAAGSGNTLPGGGGATLPTGLPGGVGTIPTTPTINPATGIPVPGAGGSNPLPGIGVPGSGGTTPGTTVSPPSGGVSTNQIPQPIINAAIIAEAMRVFQAEAKLIQAEANGKFTDELKLDKWDKKTRQTRQQHNLAVLYTRGVGVPLDFQSAFKWFKIAADEGLAEAQLNIGIALQSGMGVKKDFVGAYKYYTLAAARGLPTAAEARDNLAQFLTQFQIRAGQRMAQGFKQRLDAKHRYISERKQAERELYEALGRTPPGSN
jgi:hypothetical protein